MKAEDIKLDDNSRYKLVDIGADGDILYTKLPDEVVIDISDPLAIHTCSKGETYENISFKYYGTVKLYWVILYANNIIDPFKELENGDILYIPRRRNIPEIKS